MTRHFFLAILAALIVTSCSPSASKKASEKVAEITKLEAEAKKNIADTANTRKLLKEYDQYAHDFPNDSLAPIYLFKSARIFDYFLIPDSAIQKYNRIYTQFPNFPKANMALFTEAYIYANEKHDLEKAKALYNEYLAKYPNTPQAKMAAMEILNLGKTPEQIMAQIDSNRQLMQNRAEAKKQSESKGK